MAETKEFDLKATLTKYWYVVAIAAYFLFAKGGTKTRRRKTKMRAKRSYRRARRAYSRGRSVMRRMRRK